MLQHRTKIVITTDPEQVLKIVEGSRSHDYIVRKMKREADQVFGKGMWYYDTDSVHPFGIITPKDTGEAAKGK